MIRIGIAQADQFHSTGRSVFQNLVRHVAEMRAGGADESLMVGRLVAQLGGTVLASLQRSDGDDEEFWHDLWQLLAALGYAATITESTTESKTEYSN
jgi:hypothetical protein